MGEREDSEELGISVSYFHSPPVLYSLIRDHVITRTLQKVKAALLYVVVVVCVITYRKKEREKEKKRISHKSMWAST